MLMTTLILGTVFWTAVTVRLIRLARIDEADTLKAYCRMECKGFSRTNGNRRARHVESSTGDTADIGLSLAYGGYRHA